MSDLPDFVLARIAEDKEAARSAAQFIDARNEWWGAEGLREAFLAYSRDEDQVAWGLNEDAAHIARHHPLRVLAECEAKRRIVQWGIDTRLAAALVDPAVDPVAATICMATAKTFETATQELALVYADHPDYRAEWRP